MNPDFTQLRSDYIDALRPAVTHALQWWDAHCPYPHTDPRPFEAMAPFHRRWIAGPAAHPRVLAIFREYWFQVQDLNNQFATTTTDTLTPPLDEAEPPAPPQEHPLDLLLNDLSSAAPDLFEVMQGVLYVPIGVSPMNGEEC